MNLEKINIPRNNCLVRLPQKYSMLNNKKAEWVLENGQKILLDTSFDVFHYCPRYATLVKNPDRLYYKKGDNTSISWKTDIETLEGDIVYFDYLTMIMALTSLIDQTVKTQLGKYIVDNEDVYVFIPYESLLFAKRDNTLIGLNGNVLLSPIYNEYKSKLILPDSIKKTEDLYMAKVIVAGNPIREYIDGCVDSIDINVGDTVFIKNYKIRLDGGLLSSLSDKDVFYLQRKNILGKEVSETLISDNQERK